MTSTSLTSLPHTRRAPALIGRAGWLWIAVLGGLFMVLHWSFIERMLRIATDAKGETRWLMIKDAIATPWSRDWSHVLVVPLISLYYIYQHRERLAAAPKRVYWPGLLILFAGMFGFAWWIYPGRNDFFQGHSMILSLFGLVLFLLGPASMKALWFPIAYLVLAVRIPGRIWEQIAWTLQLIAAHCSTIAMNFIGVFLDLEAAVRGSTIQLIHKGVAVMPPLNVAEACSGLRMLMAFVALGVALAFLWDRAWWQRLIMMITTVPIAILVNVGRVTTVGLLQLVNPEMTRGDFHIMVGLFMLIPAAMLFLLVGWVLDRIIIQDESAQDPSPEPGDREFGTGAPSLKTHESVTLAGGRIAKGVLGGVTLAVLVGLNYALALALIAPAVRERLAAWMGSAATIVAMVVLGLLLVAVLVGVIRMVRTRRGAALGVGVGVLLTATFGLNSVVAATKTVLIKRSVPLRVQLDRLDRQLGNWQMIHEDPPMSPAELEALNTSSYVSRVYLDTQVSQPEPVDLARDVFEPGSVVRLHVAYYTGTPDTVPHVPDRCFTAAGLRRAGQGTARLHLEGDQFRKGNDGWWHAPSKFGPVRLPTIDFSAAIFSFYAPRQPDRKSSVIYFFSANGKYLNSPDRVRLRGFDPTDRYSYYCKIEVNLPKVGDTDFATER
ncbi:MAG: exosortase/archaeosortase family protein, partial [Phycisphaeraceae bacterium]